MYSMSIARLSSRYAFITSCTSQCISRQSSYSVLQMQKRHHKYQRGSFLSDEEGVKNFIDLLGPRERQMLHNGLKSRLADEPLPPLNTTDLEAPSRAQLKLVFLQQLIPFVGFGFLDNLIMIVAGEYIDTTIGMALGISTMAAAGLGNALSDVAGIGSAWYVERLAARVGVMYPNLSKQQGQMKSTKWVTQGGRGVGVFLGCLLGMFPLLFLPGRPSEDTKDAKHAAGATGATTTVTK